MNEIAQWIGYGVMVACGGILVVLALILVYFALIGAIGGSMRGMKIVLERAYDLNTLRKTMRQLEAEGKVKRRDVGNG